MRLLLFTSAPTTNCCCLHHRHRWVAVVFPLFLVAAAAPAVTAAAAAESSSKANALSLSAATECDPNHVVTQVRSVSSSSSSSPNNTFNYKGYHCGPNRHCVWNGKSSLGGYCTENNNNNNNSYDMVLPEALQEVCFVCELPRDNHPMPPHDDPDGTTTTSNSNSNKKVVTDPNETVGHFRCGELETLGSSGKLPRDSCKMFQHMIYANDLCGCSSSPPNPGQHDPNHDIDDAVRSSSSSASEIVPSLALRGGAASVVSVAMTTTLLLLTMAIR